MADSLAKDPDARPTAQDIAHVLGGRGSQATAVAVPRPEGGWTGPNPAVRAAPPGTPPPYAATPPPYTSTPPPAYPPTRPAAYQPPSSYQPYQGPPERRRNSRPGWLLPVVAMGVLVIAAAIAITILATSNNGSTPAAHKSTTPTQSAGTSPTSSPSPTQPSATSGNAQQQAATALDSLLTDSSRNRANVVAAVASVASCQDPAGAVATLTQAANDRQAELNRLQTLDLSALIRKRPAGRRAHQFT